jgi:sugar lactone lactonase YvrE
MQRPQTLIAGLAFPESPRWHDGRLWLADWGTQQILAVAPNGEREVMISLPSFPFSFDWLPDGRLLIITGDGRLATPDVAGGALVTYADLTSLSGHPWNEIVADGRGNAYINNIGFDFPEGEFAAGIIVLVSPDGTARQVADDVAFPNGMAMTPDNATLIVAESYGNRLTAFEIEADGSLTNRRVWADLGDGAPDGICLDAEGAVWYGDVPNARGVRVAEGGRMLQAVDLDRGCFACILGGSDRSKLFMLVADWSELANAEGGGAASGEVRTIEAPAPGVGWP